MLADRYELDHEIGRGGMGSVWLGHDVVLDRTVAVKQIGMGHGGGEPDLERAEREAHLAARINHQNVVAVFDLVDEDGHQWLVMEHVDGPTLAAVIADRGALSPGELTPLVRQVAGALAAAHEHGIVHRDVKPSNILLTSGGVAKLSDFGVARAQADASLTQTGIVTGSPAYLSPEVASGRTATAASDVWSLGATLFHALTGHPPYEVGDNVLGAMYRIVHDEPPRPDVGGPLSDLVVAMMQHDPQARPTMADVEAASLASTVAVEDLDATQGFVAFSDTVEPTPTTAFQLLELPVAESPVTEPPVTGPRVAEPRRVPIWMLAGAAAALLAVIAFLGLRGGDDDPAAGSPSAAAPAGDAGPDDAATPSPSPDAEQADEATQALEGFVADYLTTAANDPDEGFTMLTPDFQRQSNGIKGYNGFWKDVKDIDVQQVSADPAALTVSYTYSFTKKGEERTDAVTLQLEKSGNGYLIAGEV